MNDKMLEKALIPMNKWESCYVVDNTIYTPICDEEDRILKTGKEVYDESKLPSKPKLISIEEKVNILVEIAQELVLKSLEG